MSPAPLPAQVQARAAQRALLHAERALLISLRATVRTATQRAVASIATLRPSPMAAPERAARARAEAAIGILNHGAAGLTTALAAAIQTGRLGAKRASLGRLGAEWEAVRVAVRRAGHPDPGPLSRPAILAASDRASASAAAGALGAAWLTATSSAALAPAGVDDLPAAVSRAADEQDYRTRRTATTEAARAYSDARDEGMGWQREQHAGAEWLPCILKIWDATLDKRVCPRCAALAGTTRPWGMSFPGGQEPGYLHANCRCLVGTLILPIPRSLGTTVPGYAVDDEHPRAA